MIRVPRESRLTVLCTRVRSFLRTARNRGSGSATGGSVLDAELTEATESRLPDSVAPPVTVEFLLERGTTPEAYVADLLGTHGGRLRQRQIVARLAWSPSTTSRLLSRMEAAGRIVRVHVGGEKIVFLPDRLPAAARPPTDRLGERSPVRARTTAATRRVSRTDRPEAGTRRGRSGRGARGRRRRWWPTRRRRRR